MKLPSVNLRAKSIGDDSWELLNFEGLPHTASQAKQVEALRQDQRWQENHCNVISRRIDNLIDYLQTWPESAQTGLRTDVE